MKIPCPECQLSTRLQPGRVVGGPHFAGRCEHCGAQLAANVRYEEQGKVKRILVDVRVVKKEVMPK